MKTIFITGTNRGLGLEFTKQYLQDGWQVFATARKPQESKELEELKQDYPLALSLYSLDITDLASIELLKSQLKGKPIDVLINNAGIFGGKQDLGNIDYEGWHKIFTSNTIAPLKITETLLSNLEAGQDKKIINITSKMGSIDDNLSGGHYLYRTSKAALNMLSKSLSVDLKPKKITVLLLHPGWVQTDMGGQNAPTSPQESIEGMRKVIASSSIQDSGKFFAYDGKEILW